MLSTVSFVSALLFFLRFVSSSIFRNSFRTPKYVTGSSQAHLLWNFIGRQRVLKHLKDSLAELAYHRSIFNNDL